MRCKSMQSHAFPKSLIIPWAPFESCTFILFLTNNPRSPLPLLGERTQIRNFLAGHAIALVYRDVVNLGKAKKLLKPYVVFLDLD